MRYLLGTVRCINRPVTYVKATAVFATLERTCTVSTAVAIDIVLF